MWPQIIGSVLGGIGSYQAQRKLGEAQDSMREAGDKAYAAGTYKPYGVTTGLGSTTFDGQNTAFALDPRYQQQQNKMLGLGNQAFDAAGGDYNQLRDQLYNERRALGAGSRQAEAQQLGGSMFGSGVTGLRMSDQSQGFAGEGTSNPYANMFMNNFAQQESQDRFNAGQEAQQQRQRDIDIGTNMLGQAQVLDQAGMGQMELGGMLGNYRSSANNQAGNNYINAYSDAADYTARRGQSIAGGLQGMGSKMGSWGSGGGGGAFSNPMARMSNYNNFSNPNYYTPQEQGTAFTKYGNTASFFNPKYSDVGGYY
tara:strand:- start:642 stop:1574 length:933 start_codon:yes stop_codon:yes gene_type:complete